MEKEPEGEVEEQESYHLLPEPKELEEDARSQGERRRS
jgi:hypothetical protein